MNNMFLVTCFIFFFINIILPFCQATHPLCNKWNTILETALTPTLNTTSSLGISAEGAARRVIGFVRENSTVLDIGGHLGIFSEAIISMYNEKFSNTFLNIGIFEPRYLFYLCQIERMAILDDPLYCQEHLLRMSCLYHVPLILLVLNINYGKVGDCKYIYVCIYILFLIRSYIT